MNYASQYERWVGHYSRASLLAEGPRSRAPVGEGLLRCIWFDQLVIPELLRTDDGRPVRVLFPGFWNTGAGPDFRRARIRLGGALLTGDVEVHLHAGDWTAHGHDRDPAYNHVVVHVSMWKGGSGMGPMRTQHGDALPLLVLEPSLVRPLDELSAEIDIEQYPRRNSAAAGVCRKWSTGSPKSQSLMVNWIFHAADARFESKISRMLDPIQRATDQRTAFAAAWIEAWGFGGHRTAYRRASAAVRPLLERLCLHHECGLEQQIESGLLSTVRGSQAAEAKPVRPHATHERRIAMATHTLLALFKGDGWERAEPLIRPSPKVGKTWSQLRRAFSDLFPPVEGCALVLKKKSRDSSRQPKLHAGSSVQHILFLNFYLPFAAAVARKEGDEGRTDYLHRIYAALPKLPENHVERAAMSIMFGVEPASLPSRAFQEPGRTARFQQGLHRLYEDFCVAGIEGCGICPVAASLAELN